jgi:hypothetical protein
MVSVLKIDPSLANRLATDVPPFLHFSILPNLVQFIRGSELTDLPEKLPLGTGGIRTHSLFRSTNPTNDRGLVGKDNEPDSGQGRCLDNCFSVGSNQHELFYLKVKVFHAHVSLIEGSAVGHPTAIADHTHVGTIRGAVRVINPFVAEHLAQQRANMSQPQQGKPSTVELEPPPPIIVVLSHIVCFLNFRPPSALHDVQPPIV